MKKTKSSVILVTLLITVSVVAAVILVGMFLPAHEEVIQGQAEVSDYRVSSKVPARVQKICVAEGDYVHQGDTLVILEAPDIDAKLSQAMAALEMAQSQAQKAHNGTRQEQIQAAYEQWQRAIAARDVAERTYNRINNLFESGVMPEQKRDEAFAQYRAAQAAEGAAKSQYDMAVNGARSEDVSAAEAQVSRALAAINEVTSYVNETVLVAAADGVVTEIFPEVGELVGTGAPIMNVSMVGDVWFTFNVREDYLPGLTVGSEVEVYLPAFDRTIPVRVTRVKDVGSFATWKATKALDQFDLKTFELRATPLETDSLTGLRGGMTAILYPGAKR
ncbi:MAG: HlyD family secretion protein [Muribaculaceae bacterium]